MNKPATLATRVTVPERVLFRNLAGEAVLLELDSGSYFGLNETGTLMWEALAGLERVDRALLNLEAELDVSAERLRTDLLDFVSLLASRSLVCIHDE